MIKSIEAGRKEDGNRSIADKIIKRLHDLEKTIENNKGRWAWELLQNAKDSIADYDNRKVSVQLELWDDRVEFRHNGLHFTEQDVRGLINQISSKEIEEDKPTKKVGRFGTGFLTTHLLSKVIDIKGVVETVDNEFYHFAFPLDRDGSITQQLVPKIENAWSQFHTSVELIDKAYNASSYNTCFSYRLQTEKQKNIAKKGLDEFSMLIPFVLAFISEIEQVEIKNNITGDILVYKNSEEIHDNLLIPITCNINGKGSTTWIIYESNEHVAIAGEVEKTESGYDVKPIEGLPRLFCEFPLIGSETFYFPMMINSFHFSPLTERDGIWLKNNKEGTDKEVLLNQDLVKQAVELYRNVIKKLEAGNYTNLFNIVNTHTPNIPDKFFDATWYADKIQKPLREIIFNAKLVEMEGLNTSKRELSKLYFPLKSYSKEVQDNLWQFLYDMFPVTVCKKEHSEKWLPYGWPEWKNLNYATIIATIAERKSIKDLSGLLSKTEQEAIKWLNQVCTIVFKDESNAALYEKYSFIPNQYGDFKLRKDLFIDRIEDYQLVKILQLLGIDWKIILLNKYITFGNYHEKFAQDIATAISLKLKPPFTHTNETRSAITLLSEWFEENPKQGMDLFADLYKRRAETFMNVVEDKDSLYRIMRSRTSLAQLSEVATTFDEEPELLQNWSQLKEISKLMRQFKTDSVEELKEVLLLAKGLNVQNKIELTQEILVGLGVSSMEELERALEDKDLAAMFNHTSWSNVETFLFVEKLIGRAINNVISHLETLEEYDVSGRQKLANTAFGGIKKNGVEISIVIRPSDYGQVIVYYASEKNYLDFENAELWIDNGFDVPRHLTLGKILKTTGIRKIPV
ncbi:hypothetical protein CLV59_105194 [Chitinophaga dinghuensis]|uniref:Uncharacterized protein n=1 Tax=Chitinophaga dinghuensis TaxID=1539050 RepID=A0A327VVQ9_9BACT|nr:ATP-binding protein [Chitinophaga dinghuensis]RAJ80087.1 hypothetical protein CLV59_105194 [Chitinophaga dinghuensis]